MRSQTAVLALACLNAINLTGEAAEIYSDTPTQRLSCASVGGSRLV